jgi:anti-anti-sigma regulatory factor
LEKCWFEAQTAPKGEPMRIDLSGVTYVDDKGSELLSRMLKDGAELRSRGVMTKAVIEEIMKKIARGQDGLRADGK